ncbi:DEAD/DEAH box helicase family protein [Methanobacterium paludis]|uniref:Type III restriction protein res subunit n=1 Tax=Methanobacterium paludis (strain DSM 25820 / JCM 18151 / SWAN1) TaxID=868131 RepID=F6D1Q7_METPW|nr:DEAD/DEAH box helicase family protein [Methanobacterium paludis]AEG17860.1 type III restriction protein res subunit [Methanobacterium paludis]
MALHKDFPESPYEFLDPDKRWLPADEHFRDQFYGQLIPPLVDKIRREVKKWRDSDYNGASDTSKSLLQYWFETEHLMHSKKGMINFRYYFAQREAVETIIYLYEIVKVEDKYDLLRFDSSGVLTESMFDESWRRFVIKMATGSGKTKVLSLILTWSYFHRLYEADSTLARNFLVITPNIIVLDRIRSDFDGLKIFFNDPVLPENGYNGHNWHDDFQLTLHIQDNVNMVRKTGNIFLTNIHRVFSSNQTSPSIEDDNTMDYFLGEKAVVSTTDSKVDLGVIVRDIDELMILNDEAHHIHDKNLAWFKSIQEIHNRLLQKGSKLSMQVDFTATPKHSNGSIFVQTVSDYPLVEAIHQHIVKLPVLPDKASRKKLSVKKSAKYSEKYEDYIDLGYLEWEKVYEEHAELGKKAVMFVMTDDTRNCDEVAQYLENRYPDLKDSVLVIHTKKNGEISESSTGKKKKELDELRKAANEIDDPNSRYKAIVSVLVLKEGWDVRNVTTIVGLRAFASKGKILPEQTLGRGLRRMYRDPEAQEMVSVIGTDAFMEFVESIQKEGVELTHKPMGHGTKPLAPLVIQIDNDNLKKDINELDIQIPILTPRIYREYNNISDLNVSRFNTKKLKIKEFTEEQQREIVFRDILSNKIKHKTKLDRNAIDYRGIIGYFAQVIMDELKIFSGYDLIYGKVKEFIKYYLFYKEVDLEDPNVLRNLSELEARKTITETFKKKINELTVLDHGEAKIRDYIKISDCRPFVTKEREYLVPKKSPFNRIIGDSLLELNFAKFLEKCDDIISYVKNYFAVHFKIDYKNHKGEISNYYPDFVVKRNEDEIYIIETKGEEDLDDVLKLKRLEQWCKDINVLQSNVKYGFVYVDEEKFSKYDLKSFQELLEVFTETGPQLTEKEFKTELSEEDKEQTNLNFNKGVPFDQWIESLPFPLASILWACITDSNNEHKVKYLIHFFEALSEFNVALMVSALSSDKEFYKREFNRCKSPDPRFQGWYLKPAFGNWNFFGSCLAKNVRRLLEDNDKSKKCLKLLGNPEKAFINMLTNKKLYNILNQVVNYRNQWEGHGPIVSPKDYEERLCILRNEVLKVRKLISNAYNNISLVLPGETRYENGVFHYKVKKLMSTRAPFKNEELKTRTPMDSTKKYLIHGNEGTPIELIPLFDIIESPEMKQEACYFYNNYDKKNDRVRFVSYHFNKESEIFLPFNDFKVVISLLN